MNITRCKLGEDMATDNWSGQEMIDGISRPKPQLAQGVRPPALNDTCSNDRTGMAKPTHYLRCWSEGANRVRDRIEQNI
jgi:hypothetical protein